MKVYFALLAGAIALASCGNNNESHDNHTTATTTETPAAQPEEINTVKPVFASLDNAVGSHINDIFQHYLHVKTALVNSNAAEAKNGAQAILKVIKDFDKSLLPADQKAAYDKRIPAIRAAANNIAGTNELEKQRVHFAALSSQAYELSKSFGAGKTVYHQHCPMAMDDKGAMWLSESKEVRNPYYGEKMMDCGTVEEVIEK